MKTFEDFLKDMDTNVELKEKTRALLEKDCDKEKIDAAIEVAKECGYDVSVEDFAKLSADRQALDEEELELVSAGRRGHIARSGKQGLKKIPMCLLDYGCEVAWNTCLVSNECQFNQGTCKSAVDDDGPR